MSLEIEVGANVNGAITGIDKVKQRIRDLYAQLDDATARQRELINPANIRAAQKQIEQVSKEIDKLEGNQGFDNLGKSAGKALGPLNDAYGAIRKIAYALPGIGIAGLIGGGIGLIADAVTQLVGASNAAENAQKLLTKTLDEGAASAQKEASGIQALGAIVLDESKSRDLRTKAFKELQNEYPGYFQNLNLEKSSLDKIKSAIDSVTSALVRQAQIKGLEGAISKLFEKQAEEATKNLKDAFSDASIFDKLKVLFNAGGNIGNGVVSLLDLQADKAKAAGDQIKVLNDQLKKLIETSLLEGDTKNLHPGKVIDETKERLRVLEDIKRVQEEIDKGNTGPIFKQARNTQINDKTGEIVPTTEIEILRAKIAEAIQGGIKDPKNADVFNDLAITLGNRLKQVQGADVAVPIDFTLQSVNPEIDKEVKKFYADSGKTLDERVHKLPPLKTDIRIIPTVTLDDVVGKKISEDLARQVSTVISGLSSAVGQALATGDLGGVFRSFGAIVGQGLKSIGEEMIALSPIIAALKTAIKTLNPALLLPAGIALVGIGSFLQTKLSAGVKGFATGGIAMGPTLGLIAEAGQPEFVIPLDRMESILGNVSGSRTQNISGRVDIVGQKLSIVLARANKNNGFAT